MGGQDEGIGCRQGDDECIHGRVGAGRQGDADRNGHEDGGGAHIRHNQAEYRCQHSDNNLNRDVRHIAEQHHGLLCDPCGCTGQFHGHADGDQAGHQEHGFPADGIVGFINAQYVGQYHAKCAGQQGNGQSEIGEYDHADRKGKKYQRLTNFMWSLLFLRDIGGDDKLPLCL